MSRSDILHWLAGYLDERGFPHPAVFDLEADFSEFGLDSVEVVILAAEFEDKFDISTDPALFLRVRHLSGLFADLETRNLLAGG